MRSGTELRVDYFLFGDTKRLYYSEFKRLLVGPTIGKWSLSSLLRTFTTNKNKSLKITGTICAPNGAVVLFNPEGERIPDVRTLTPNLTSMEADEGNGEPGMDVATLVLRIYRAYARRYCGFSSQTALRNPDGAFALTSVQVAMRKHSDNRQVPTTTTNTTHHIITDH